MTGLNEELERDDSTFNLLDDDYEDTTSYETEAEESQEVAEPTGEKEPAEEPTAGFEIEYKFDHEVGKITDKEEAKRLLQLGLYHEKKVKPEYDALKQQMEQYKSIEDAARAFGMSVSDVGEMLKQQAIANEAEETGKSVEEIRLAREVDELKAQLNSKNTKSREEKMIEELIEEYPDVDSSKISAETWRKVREEGKDLVREYTKQLLLEAKQQQTIMEQNTKNRATSPVGSTTKNGTQTSVDDDLDDAFLGYYR